jgi:hypothetical protein
MRALVEFTKTTVIGGFLIVLPIYVSLLLVAKALKGLVALGKRRTMRALGTVWQRRYNLEQWCG